MKTCRDLDWTNWTPEVRCTLLFILVEGRILLIRKKRGFGMGKVNGPGGKISVGETPREAAIREVEEEVGVTPTSVSARGTLSFQFVDGLAMHVHVFTATGFVGEVAESDEALPFWAATSEIPFSEMWADDAVWVPSLLKGHDVTLRAVFDGDAMLDYALDLVSSGAPDTPNTRANG